MSSWIRTLRTPSAVILALAILGAIGYLMTGHVPSVPHSGYVRLEPGFDTNSRPCERALNCHLRVEQTRRSLWTAGIPGESLLLAEANSAEDSGASLAETDPRSTGSQRHKNLLPLNKWDIATLVVASLGLMIAAAGGIGGGGMLVPIFILVLRFSPKYAVPLSNVAIFGGAITNTILNTRKRHPIADRPLIDWDLILAMEPLTIGGALVGSFIQKVLPEVVLTLMMVLLLLVTADRTLRKGTKVFKKESLQRKAVLNKAVVGDGALKKSDEALLGSGQAGPGSYGAADNDHVDNDQVDNDQSNYKDGNDQFPPAVLATAIVPSPEVVEKGETSGMVATATESSEDEISLNGPSSNGPSVSLEDLLEEERKTPLAKVRTMTIIFAALLTVNLLKGGGAFRSPVGIVCGSLVFWATTILCLVYLIVVSLVVRQYLIKRWRLKQQLNYQYVEGDVEWNPLNTLRYPFICCFAGFFAGMFGVGGGIVKGPLMLEMGVNPMVASATSAVMILYTSFTATTSFMVFGLLKADYAVVLFFLGLIATAAGQVGTDYLVKKFKRPSFIILSIGSVVAISAVLMGYNGVTDILESRAAGEVGASSICEAGM